MANYILSGPTSVQVNGIAYSTSKTVKYTVNNINQELQENWSFDDAIKINVTPIKVTIGFLVTPTFDPTAFVGLTNSEVVLLLANGKTASYSSMNVTSVGEISADEGICEIEFQTYTQGVLA